MTAPKPVVLLAEELSPATVEALGPDFEIRTTDGADRTALLRDIADADAVLVRSATQIDAEALAAARSLKVVARAGVGLDNVDVPAATAAGVMVVNAPTSNIISAAELTCGHILSLARRIPAAHASLTSGQWKRSSFTGVELNEKTLGVIGLGRIGALVTERMKAFGMKVVAFDPHVTAARAGQLGVTLTSLDELLEQSDFITIHMPKTPETVGMLGEAQFKRMKPTAYVINVARGGLIDEAALHAALEAGEIAGAGIDVFAKEPSTDLPFFGHPNTVVTPHLGASTDEAQEKAGIAVARSVRLALAGELVPDAVNVAGGVIHEDVRPGIDLAERLGRVFTALAHGSVTQIDVEVAGEVADKDVTVLELSALKGIFRDIVSEHVSYVNAPVIAEGRGIDVRLSTTTKSEDYRNVTSITGTVQDGTRYTVRGTVSGPKLQQKLVGINEYDLEIALTDHLVVLRYADRPGIIGTIGRLLGENGVNIGGMQVGRRAEGDSALAVLAVDTVLPEGLGAALAEATGADLIREVNLQD